MPEGLQLNPRISSSRSQPLVDHISCGSDEASSNRVAMRKDSVLLNAGDVVMLSSGSSEAVASSGSSCCRRTSIRNDVSSGLHKKVSFREKRQLRMSVEQSPEEASSALEVQAEICPVPARSVNSVHRTQSHREVRPSITSTSSFQLKGQSYRAKKRSTSFCDSLRQGENYQVLMLGAVGVGKSSLVRQFQASNMNHVRIQVSNVYGDNCKKVNEAQLVILDNPAREITAEMALACCDVDAYVVVYSVTDRDSFQVAKHILNGISSQENFSKKAAILVGNKVDLVRKRAVTTDEGKICATTCECKFIETSDWIDYNVDELFEGVLAQIRLRLETPCNMKNGNKKRERRSYRRSKTLGAKSWGMLKDFINRINRKVKSCDDLHVL